MTFHETFFDTVPYTGGGIAQPGKLLDESGEHEEDVEEVVTRKSLSANRSIEVTNVILPGKGLMSVTETEYHPVTGKVSVYRRKSPQGWLFREVKIDGDTALDKEYVREVLAAVPGQEPVVDYIYERKYVRQELRQLAVTEVLERDAVGRILAENIDTDLTTGFFTIEGLPPAQRLETHRLYTYIDDSVDNYDLVQATELRGVSHKFTHGLTAQKIDHVGFVNEKIQVRSGQEVSREKTILPVDANIPIPEHSEVGKTLVDFISFVRSNLSALQELSRQIPLEDVFRNYFCLQSGNIGDILAQRKPDLEKKYAEQIDRLKELSTIPGVTSSDRDPWIDHSIHGGVPETSTKGRIYFNVLPEHLANFYQLLVERCAQARLWVQTKALKRIDTPRYYNRADKIVLYFGVDYTQEVSEVIQSIYQTNPTWFPGKESTPRFSAPVIGPDGQRLHNIAFGQSPRISKASFSEMRSHMLAKLFQRGVGTSVTTFEPALQIYREECRKLDIDPAAPAFNTSGKGVNFFQFRQAKDGLGIVDNTA